MPSLRRGEGRFNFFAPHKKSVFFAKISKLPSLPNPPFSPFAVRSNAQGGMLAKGGAAAKAAG